MRRAKGAVDAARALAESGANLDLTDPEGTTALIVAIINGHYDVAAVLVEKGANPNIADIKGMTPLYAAVDMHTIGDTFGRPYPPREVIDGSLEAARMLITGGANVNARLTAPILKRVYDAGDNRLGEGATPFMRAARKCDVGDDADPARRESRRHADAEERQHAADAVCRRGVRREQRGHARARQRSRSARRDSTCARRRRGRQRRRTRPATPRCTPPRRLAAVSRRSSGCSSNAARGWT